MEAVADRRFDLVPGLGAIRAIRRVDALRDDAFQVHAARGLEHLGTVGLHVLAVEHWRSQARLIVQRLQDPLALDERRLPQVKSLQVEQIEGVVDHPVLPAVGEVGLQRAEIGPLIPSSTNPLRRLTQTLSLQNILYRNPAINRSSFGSRMARLPGQL
jgi:hypothetical protein